MIRVTTIRGSFATQLAKHVGDKIDGDPLWAARFNATDPEAVLLTHLEYLEHGAEIIDTNTYQASVEGYQEHLNLSREQSIELIKTSVKLAQKAREQFLKKSPNAARPQIFAAIGCYGAHLHDGSEYTGSYIDRVSIDEIKKWHKVRIDACLEAGVDGLEIETIPSKVEAEGLVDLMLSDYPNVKFWMSFQCNGENKTLAYGDDFAEVASLVWEKAKSSGNILAVGVNCINPIYVTNLFKSLNESRVEKIPLVVYPNSGELYIVGKGWSGKKECAEIVDYIEEWIELGAIFIGSCCRTTVEDTEKIRAKIDSIQNMQK